MTAQNRMAERAQNRVLEIRIRCSAASDTRDFGRRVGAIARSGDTISLSGELGAGKTTLVQGIAVGLEVPPNIAVASPTYSIVHEYPGRLPLTHMDFYRLDSAQLDEIGLEEVLEGDGVCVAEWAERWPTMWQRANLRIRIEGNDGARTLHVWTDEPRFAEVATTFERMTQGE